MLLQKNTAVAAIPFVLTLTADGSPTGGYPLDGTFVLTFRGASTPPIPVNVGMDELEAALNGLRTISGAGGCVAVVPLGPYAFSITFGSALAAAPQPLISATASFVGGVAPVLQISEVTVGGPAAAGQATGTDEVQELAITYSSPAAWYALDGAAPVALPAPTDQGGGVWAIGLPAAATQGDCGVLLITAAGCRTCILFYQTWEGAVDPAAMQAACQSAVAAAGLATADQLAARTLPAAQYAIAGVEQSLSPDERNALADAILARSVATAQATADDHSLCYAVLLMSQADRTSNPGFITVYRTDGVTEFCRKAIDTSPNVAAVTGVGETG